MPMHDSRSFREARTLNEGKNSVSEETTAHIRFRIQESKRRSKGHAIDACATNTWTTETVSRFVQRRKRRVTKGALITPNDAID